MKILIIGKVTSGQVNRLKEEGQKRGHIVENCSSHDLIIRAVKNQFEPLVVDKKISDFDLIYLLTVGRRKWEWYLACKTWQQKHGLKVVEQKMVDPNHKIYFTPTVELEKQVKEGICFPKTTVVLSNKYLKKALFGFEYPVIIKNSYQHRGLGVHKVENYEEAKKIVEGDEQSDSFRIKEFIPNDGDVRVFTIGFKAIGAMKRTPTKEGEFRSNISFGGKGEIFDLKKNLEVKKMAEKISEVMKSEIAGVDIIIHEVTKVPYVIEVNRGPQFAGLEKYAKVNAAEEIIKYFESLLK